MIKHPAQRVAVLVDAQNMYHSAKHLHGARLNFGKAVEDMVDGRPLIRAIAYVAKSKTGEESAFFDALIESKIEPKIKDVQEFSSGAKKADWDVGMAIDAVKLSEKVDVIILMTGDGDFVPLVEYLHGRGVIVEVAAFGESTNSQLRECVDHFYDLSSSQKYLIRAGRRVGSKTEGDEAEKGQAPRGDKRIKVTF
ncbi:MAG: NYN domain-containing protein [Patescibacteria group bacterium]